MMTTNKFPVIDTERLSLRALVPSDWKVVSFLRTDPVVNKYVERPPAETEEKALEFIARINKYLELQQAWYWSISPHENKLMIGSICLYNFSEDKKVAEIGYDLHPEHQGKGIMAESVHAILQFGFETLHLDRIEAFTHVDNEGSRRLLEKNNFVLLQARTDADNKNNVIYEVVRK
ncbi:MAG TPA: GNAT family N-acetyltransferase [Flavobacterium sp.]|jgi:ribosomal-protein-alanine N-acetyltransferase|nr:GNAT family N-acetyltransferase [Flavobacterium sp.]